VVTISPVFFPTLFMCSAEICDIVMVKGLVGIKVIGERDVMERE